jgi:hypothetical protein
VIIAEGIHAHEPAGSGGGQQQRRHKKRIVYAKRTSANSPGCCAISAATLHRIAISNHRLLAFDGEHVTLRRRFRPLLFPPNRKGIDSPSQLPDVPMLEAFPM